MARRCKPLSAARSPALGTAQRSRAVSPPRRATGMPSRRASLLFSRTRSCRESVGTDMRGALNSSQTKAFRWLASVLSALPGRRALLILTFHRVLPEPDTLLDDPSAAAFAELVDLFASLFRPLTVHEAVARLRAGELPPRSICITFDDGYANNCEVALPILHSKGVPATFFVSTGFLGGGCMWNDVV